MKKTIIISIATLLFCSFKNLPKTFGIVAGVGIVESLKGQNVSTYIDNTLHQYVIYETNSPSNYPGACNILMRFKRDSSFVNQSLIMFTGMTQAAVTGSHKMTSISPSGSICVTSFSDISVPYSQLSGTPTIPSSPTLAALTGMSVTTSGSSYSLTNTLPMVTQSLSGANGLTVTSGANTFTVTRKRQDTYTANTASTGIATFTFAAFTTTPNIQYNLGFGAGNKETVIPNAAPTTTSCSYYVQLRADVLGLLPSYSNVNNREVNILVTEK